eukprot:maker-scaffold872_size86337-snap-gene-0.17 protein:Tk06112 transcript:maker-scaffold872_size86337-snap-gene-0.17-mRNA-1 annotation:"PREDICTED: uncharacterized protein LOC103573133"
MALLTRYFQLGDADGTQVFNFIVTKAVTRDLKRDVISKDFVYGFHRWALSFSREEKTLGIYLVWRSPSEGINVSLDLMVTLLNREAFDENRSFSIRKATFLTGYHQNGNRGFIKIGDLLTHRPRFVDTNGEFQVELRLAKVETYLEKDLFFPRNPKMLQDAASSASSLTQVSSEFQYGVFTWTVTVKPQTLLTWKQDSPGINVILNRKFRANSQSLLCRLSYTYSAGFSDKRVESDRRDEMIGTNENGIPWTPRIRLHDCFVRKIRDGGLVRIRVDLHSAHAMTEYFMQAAPTAAGDAAAVNVDSLVGALSRENSNAPAVMGTDSDAANWALESDTHSSFMRFSLLFLDINKIPCNHLRLVQWRSFLVRRSKRWRGHRDEKEQIELVDFQSGNVFSRYYFHDESDQGIMMETTIPTKEVKDGVNEFLEDSAYIRVRIQWEYNHQLFQATVHQYDDIVRQHNVQMRDEIGSLKEKIRRLELAAHKLDEDQKHQPTGTSRPEGQTESDNMFVFVKKGSAGSMDSNHSGESSTSSEQNNNNNAANKQANGKDLRTSSLNDEIFINTRELLPQKRIQQLGRSPPKQYSLDSGPDPPQIRGRPRTANILTLPINTPGNCGLIPASGSSLSRSPSPRPPRSPLPRRVIRQKTMGDRPHPPPPQPLAASSWNDIRPPPPSSTHNLHSQEHLPGGGPSSSGTGSLWSSPTLRRVFAPLRQSLSVSADSLPNKTSKSPLVKTPWANIRLAQMSKCQSVD